MTLSNLGILTDLATLGDAAVLTRADGHLVVRCPEMPTFYWGNFLLFERAPDDVEACIAAFQSTFGDDPRIRHVAIGWQDPTGDGPAIAAFRERGYLIDDCAVTTASEPPPPRPLPAGMRIDRCRTDEDWQAVLDLGVACRDTRHGEAGYTAYLKGVITQRRRQAAAGRMRWYLARFDGRVVGDMGLFAMRAMPAGLAGQGIAADLPIARFQAVKTHPDFRRRGVCSALLTHVCRDALGPQGMKQLVILVDEQGPAWRIYQRHGFRTVGRTRGAWRPPSSDWSATPAADGPD